MLGTLRFCAHVPILAGHIEKASVAASISVAVPHGERQSGLPVESGSTEREWRIIAAPVWKNGHVA